MKFRIINDVAHGWSAWTLLTNTGETIATSSAPFSSLEEAQKSIKDFKVWVGQAPVGIVNRVGAEHDHLFAGAF